MLSSFRKWMLLAVPVVALLAAPLTADARWGHHGHRGWHRGWGGNGFYGTRAWGNGGRWNLGHRHHYGYYGSPGVVYGRHF